MPHDISRVEDIAEVKVWGQVTEAEIASIILDLHRQDPAKEKNDLWTVAPESMLPFRSFPLLVDMTRKLLPSGARCVGRSAMVAADAFRKAQLDMYTREAESLPFQIRVFLSRDEATKWLAGGHGDGDGEEGR
jgi:hypothetical protein